MTRKLEVLFGAALAAIVPAGAASAGAPHASPAPFRTLPRNQDSEGFHPPQTPVLLTREVRKTLSDGQQFVSRRQYAVRFLPHADGYRVEGELVGSEVEAPAELAPLAEIERTRAEARLFPLQLDRDGMILAEAAPATTRLDAAQVATAAAAYLDRGAITPTDRAAALAMVSRLQTQTRSAGSTWPVDLFHPASGERTETRALGVPGAGESAGMAGRVTITMRASKTASGLLERLQREVVTDLAGTRRLTVETWTLAAGR